MISLELPRCFLISCLCSSFCLLRAHDFSLHFSRQATEKNLDAARRQIAMLMEDLDWHRQDISELSKKLEREASLKDEAMSKLADVQSSFEGLGGDVHVGDACAATARVHDVANVTAQASSSLITYIQRYAWHAWLESVSKARRGRLLSSHFHQHRNMQAREAVLHLWRHLARQRGRAYLKASRAVLHYIPRAEMRTARRAFERLRLRAAVGQIRRHYCLKATRNAGNQREWAIRARALEHWWRHSIAGRKDGPAIEEARPQFTGNVWRHHGDKEWIKSGLWYSPDLINLTLQQQALRGSVHCMGVRGAIGSDNSLGVVDHLSAAGSTGRDWPLSGASRNCFHTTAGDVVCGSEGSEGLAALEMKTSDGLDDGYILCHRAGETDRSAMQVAEEADSDLDFPARIWRYTMRNEWIKGSLWHRRDSLARFTRADKRLVASSGIYRRASEGDTLGDEARADRASEDDEMARPRWLTRRDSPATRLLHASSALPSTPPARVILPGDKGARALDVPQFITAHPFWRERLHAQDTSSGGWCHRDRERADEDAALTRENMALTGENTAEGQAAFEDGPRTQSTGSLQDGEQSHSAQSCSGEDEREAARKVLFEMELAHPCQVASSDPCSPSRLSCNSTSGGQDGKQGCITAWNGQQGEFTEFPSVDRPVAAALPSAAQEATRQSMCSSSEAEDAVFGHLFTGTKGKEWVSSSVWQSGDEPPRHTAVDFDDTSIQGTSMARLLRSSPMLHLPLSGRGEDGARSTETAADSKDAAEWAAASTASTVLQMPALSQNQDHQRPIRFSDLGADCLAETPRSSSSLIARADTDSLCTVSPLTAPDSRHRPVRRRRSVAGVYAAGFGVQ